MPKPLTHMERASIRQALAADGRTEAQIEQTIADIQAWRETPDEDEPQDDSWTRQLKSTRADWRSHI